jgi:NADP-dependent 3-hydroxy acid dehydrogenase YdfG
MTTITVLVTGAANGIGFETASLLAKKGLQVIATDVAEERLKKLKEKDGIITCCLDVTDAESIKDAVSFVSSEFSKIDILINGAGIFVAGPLVEIKEEVVEKIIDVNILGPFRVTKAFFPLLNKQTGMVINLGSETGRFAYPFNGPYTMTKYALEAYSDSLRRELQCLGIKVVLLQIGPMKTSMTSDLTNTFSEHLDVKQTSFKKQLEMMAKTTKNEYQNASDPICVAKKIHSIIFKRNHRSRYRVKNNFKRSLLEFLPTRLVDFFMKKYLT